MGRAAIVAGVLFAALVEAASPPRFKRFTERQEPGRSTRGLLALSSVADAGPPEPPGLFGFATISGRGMGTVCSGEALTTPDGGALTFTRPGAAYCLAGGYGNRTTGIANGDLIQLASDQPRTEYDSDGVLGLLVESGAWNWLSYSEEFDNAYWTKLGGAVVSGINAAVAPNGTTTAERVLFSSCAGSTSALYRANDYGYVASVYGKAVSGAQNISVCGAAGCSQCALNSSTWTRCYVADGAQLYGVSIGCVDNPALSGHANTGSADVYLWGAMAELLTYDGSDVKTSFPSSYVPTYGSATLRAADTARINPGVALGGVGGRLSMSSYANSISPTNMKHIQLDVYDSASASRAIAGFLPGLFNHTVCFQADATNAYDYAYTGATGSYMDARKFACSSTASVINGSWYGVPFTPSSTTYSVATVNRVSLMQYHDRTDAAYYQNGIISRVCIDPDPTVCQ